MEDGIVDIEKVKKIKKIMPSDDLLFAVCEATKEDRRRFAHDRY